MTSIAVGDGALVGFGVLLLVAVLVAVFRREIREQLPRLTSASAEGGPVKLAVELAPPAPSQGAGVAGSGGGEEALNGATPDDEVDQIAASDGESEAERSTFSALWKAGQANDEAEFERLAKRLCDEAESEEDRRIASFQVLAVRYATGMDSGAVIELEKRAADDPEYRAFIKNLIGVCHEMTGNLAAAEKAFREGVEHASGAERATIAENLAGVLARAGTSAEALSILRDELRRGISDRDAERRVWEKLASIAAEGDDQALAAAYKEKATEFRANDGSAQFSVGWTYGDIPGAFFGPAAVHHYNKALAFDPATRYANNNAAIQLHGMNLPIEAINRFRAEAEEGGTLAMANLAQQYFIAGFTDEADDFLRRAEEDDAPDARVAEMRAALNEARLTEQETLRRVRENGQRQAEFMRAVAEATVAEPVQLSFDSWSGDSKRDVALEEDEDRLTISWKSLGTKRYEFTRNGNALRGSRRKQGYSKGMWENVSEAVGFIDTTSVIHAMWRSDSGIEFEEFRPVK